MEFNSNIGIIETKQIETKRTITEIEEMPKSKNEKTVREKCVKLGIFA